MIDDVERGRQVYQRQHRQVPRVDGRKNVGDDLEQGSLSRVKLPIR